MLNTSITEDSFTKPIAGVLYHKPNLEGKDYLVIKKGNFEFLTSLKGGQLSHCDVEIITFRRNSKVFNAYGLNLANCTYFFGKQGDTWGTLISDILMCEYNVKSYTGD